MDREIYRVICGDTQRVTDSEGDKGRKIYTWTERERYIYKERETYIYKERERYT